MALALKSLIDHSFELQIINTKLFNWNFYSLEVVSRCRDPQLQVSENYSDLTNWRVNDIEILLICATFYLCDV